MADTMPEGFFRAQVWTNGSGALPYPEPPGEMFVAIIGPGWIRVQWRNGNEVVGSVIVPTDGVAYIQEIDG